MFSRTPTRWPVVTLSCLLLGAALVLLQTACADTVPTGAESSSHDHPDLETSVSRSEVAQVLNDLRRQTAAWHDLANAEAAGYAVNIGCIDERITGLSASDARGMGYHFAGGAAFDNVVDIVEPELVVYGQKNNGTLRLAGFDYFIPASETYPPPPSQPPVFPELDLPFTWSPQFGGWMFHIWPFWHNPDGMFDNFNPAVPLCDCQLPHPDTGPICYGPDFAD